MNSPVRTKLDFVRRYKLGEFGNCSPTWDTIDEFMKSDYRGLVHIRNRVAGGATWYDIPSEAVDAVFYNICWTHPRRGKPEEFYFSGMAPTPLTLLQGEVQRTHRQLELFYSTVKKPMRDALSEKAVQVYGILAVELLHQSLNTASYEWMEYLLDKYPDHVVEFSAYDVCWGTVPGHNTCFWEIRQY